MRVNQKPFFFLFSILLHLIIGYAFFHEGSNTNALWSGGGSLNPQDVVFVNLDTISDSEETAQTEESQPEEPVAQKSLIKQKEFQEKKPQVSLKTAKKNIPSSGSAFDPNGSTTPNTGVGPGLDASGVIGPNAPNILAKIRKKIYSKKVYPMLAKENKIIGKVGIIFQINEDGSLKYVTIRKSSGQDILDAAAIKAVQKAAPLPYYPLAISTTIEYELKEEL